VKRTFTSKLSNMLGTQKLAQRVNAGKRLEINDKPQRGGTDFRFVSALKLLIEKVHGKLN